MKKLLCIGLMCLMAMTAFGQDNKVVRKIQIRHADPQLIFLLLSGKTTFSTPPELSTIIYGFGGNGGFGGSGFGGGSFGNGGFGNGFGGGNPGGPQGGGSGNGGGAGGR